MRRPNSSSTRGILLAKVLLRLAHEELRWRRQTRAHITDYQPRRWDHNPRIRMAAEIFGGHCDPTEHGSEINVVPAGQSIERLDLPSDESSDILLDRMHCVLLGVQ